MNWGNKIMLTMAAFIVFYIGFGCLHAQQTGE